MTLADMPDAHFDVYNAPATRAGAATPAEMGHLAVVEGLGEVIDAV